MAKVGPQRAAELTGRSKSTIQRAMKSGKLSFELDANGRRIIDVSELDRAFGLKQSETSSAQAENANSAEVELEKATHLIEMERMKMRIRMLEEQLEAANSQIEDLQGQRDQWQKQASQMLITSQYSQKQAEELRQQIREREERVRQAKERRQKEMLEQRMHSMNADNENVFSGLLKKIRGAA